MFSLRVQKISFPRVFWYQFFVLKLTLLARNFVKIQNSRFFSEEGARSVFFLRSCCYLQQKIFHKVILFASVVFCVYNL